MKLRIALGIIMALLVTLVIVVVVLITRVDGAREQDRYEDCLSRQGFAPDAPPPPGVSVDDYIDSLAGAAENCTR